MAQQHRIIPSCIRVEPLERQLLVAEVFQRPVCQLVTATFMVAGNNPVCFQVVLSANSFQQRIDVLSLADIGNNDRIGSASRQIDLITVIDQPAIDSSSESIPGFAFTSKLNILPVVFFAGTIVNPHFICRRAGNSLDIFIQLPTADITDFQFFTEIENLLVEKTAVHPDNDSYILASLVDDNGWQFSFSV